MPKKPKAICYFDGETRDAVRAALNEYPDGRLVFYRGEGNSFLVNVTGGDDGADDTPSDNDDDDQPLNDSHPCPGSPGCP